MLVGQSVRVNMGGAASGASVANLGETADGDAQLSMVWGVTSLNPAATVASLSYPGQDAPPAAMATPAHAAEILPPRPAVGALPCFSIPTAPMPVTTCASPPTNPTFSCTPAGTGPFTYQWQIQTAPGVWRTLTNDPATFFPCPGGGTGVATISTLNAASVNIRVTGCPGPAGAPTHWPIRCIVSNPCGPITSGEAIYTICPADFDCSGASTVGDIFSFLSAWFASDPRADINGTGGISVQDIFDFLGAWFNGC